MSVQQVEQMWKGVWRNRKGSLLRIDQIDVRTAGGEEQYLISGRYQSAKGGVDLSDAYPVSGFVSNDQIAFSVSFRYQKNGELYSSVTAWAGQILPTPEDPATQNLQTLWNLVPGLNEGDEEEGYGWVLSWSGADTFQRISRDPDHQP